MVLEFEKKNQSTLIVCGGKIYFFLHYCNKLQCLLDPFPYHCTTLLSDDVDRSCLFGFIAKVSRVCTSKIFLASKEESKGEFCSSSRQSLFCLYNKNKPPLARIGKLD